MALTSRIGDERREVHDARGRMLVVRPIAALDRLRLLKAAGPELSQNDAWLDMASLAFALTEIDGVPRPPPINERQIEATVAELGDHGLVAVAAALNEIDQATSLFTGPPEGNPEGTPS